MIKIGSMDGIKNAVSDSYGLEGKININHNGHRELYIEIGLLNRIYRDTKEYNEFETFPEFMVVFLDRLYKTRKVRIVNVVDDAFRDDVVLCQIDVKDKNSIKRGIKYLDSARRV